MVKEFFRASISVLAAAMIMCPVVLVADGELTIEAVKATYDQDTSTTIFEGQVDLSSEDVRLTADRVELMMLEDGNGIVTATGTPIEFQVAESSRENYASGIADSAKVDYSTEVIYLIGNVTFEQGELVINTQQASYNWSTRHLETSQIADGDIDPSDNRTTIKIQLQN